MPLLSISIGASRANRTQRGFKLEVYPQSTTRPADWIDDTFYIVPVNLGWNDPTQNPNSTTPPEPTVQGDAQGQYLKKYVISSTSGLDLIPNGQTGTNLGSFYIDVRGLPDQARQYHVYGYRHYTDQSTDIWNWTAGAVPLDHERYRTMDTRIELVHQGSSWTEDWSKGYGDWVRDGDQMGSFIWEAHSGDLTVGNFMRQFSVSSGPVGTGYDMRSRLTWRPDQPFTVKVKMRQGGARHKSTLSLMLGGPEILELATTAGTWQYSAFLPTGTNGGPISLGAPAHPLDTWQEAQVQYDGTGTVSLMVDGVTYVTLTGRTWDGPISCWLGNTLQGAESPGTICNHDYGPVTITGSFDVWSFADSHSNKSYATTSDYGIQEAAPNVGLYTYDGGITMRPTSGNLVGSDPSTDVYPIGSFQVNTPALMLAPGHSYSQLKLAGNTKGNQNGTTVHGTLKAYVRRYDGTLVPDTEIPGNSSGFSPSGTSDTVVSLSGVTTDGIYVDLQGTNTTAGNAPPLWQRATVLLNYDATAASNTADFVTRRALTTSVAQETETALPITHPHVAGLPVEIDTAFGVAAFVPATPGHVTLSDSPETVLTLSDTAATNLTLSDGPA